MPESTVIAGWWVCWITGCLAVSSTAAPGSSPCLDDVFVLEQAPHISASTRSSITRSVTNRVTTRRWYDRHLSLWLWYHPDIYPDPLSLAIPLWVCAMRTDDGFGYTTFGKKQQVLCSSGHCDQDWRCADLLYASLIGSDPGQLKGQRGWAPLHRT